VNYSEQTAARMQLGDTAWHEAPSLALRVDPVGGADTETGSSRLQFADG
jgi:hypothetical protein